MTNAKAAGNGDTQPETPIRVGVVGLGYAGEQHLLGYAARPDVQIVGLAGLEDARRDALAERFAIPHPVRGYEELLDLDLDVVSVCVPNALHAPIGVAALESGRHVLSEKPLARSGDEAATMVDAAEAADRVLHVAFNYRRRGDVQLLRRVIDEGTLGRIYHVKAWWLRRRGIPSLGSWFTSKEQAGGGPLIDLGVHVLDLALHLTDQPSVLTVSAVTHAELGPRGRGGSDAGKFVEGPVAYGVEDLASVFLRLGGDVSMTLETAWAVHGSHGDDFGLTLYGTEGGAELTVRNYGVEDTLRVYTDVGGALAEARPKVPRGDGHVGIVAGFVDVLRGPAAAWAAHRGHDGLRLARVLDAAYASASAGREIELPAADTEAPLAAPRVGLPD
ncbi:MAG: hypothetical protein AVDCRST_MAG79-2054 [uncultured Thermoleophilia bacterium]|uniref:GH109 n=1 Tax=uncultured Thermoleophilia bacterium TaxID=1497501 RepID=A0A6J4U8I0_9ACTN|nr:MAG: hypothetical protein AVDCRST_MAG79-2054 [uncultured Thermoleophilia bacterium]